MSNTPDILKKIIARKHDEIAERSQRCDRRNLAGAIIEAGREKISPNGNSIS